MSTIGLIIATHGGLAEGLKSAIQLIMGPQDNLRTIGLQPGKDIQDMKHAIKEKIIELNQYNHVFIMSDLFGGTPSNSTTLVQKEFQHKVRHLTGVNLPMLIQFYTSTTDDPDQLAEEIIHVSKDSVQVVTGKVQNEEFQLE
ncbi:PTS system mannose-specific IIA component [Bacillus oleivorans]|uniref:PTS system mannose-specific IIA component n=1 Tax=Bacillus oleivorans TaxID=1448271 RepID=A0A285CPG6_9BACI|nr:PTS sugar transporter subunit IIA [Bacillus oleivorans]SNX69480.1 PTS system mannose-specific IIA component [Bacillus oleivorans]